VWFDDYEAAGCDGIIAKRADLAYQHGKRAMIKIKHRRTIDVVVGGFREHKDGGKIGSLLLGLYNDKGEFHFIGHCSGFPNADRVEIYDRFMELRSEESFDEAARAPGGPSRWSAGKDNRWTPVKPGSSKETASVTPPAFTAGVPTRTPESATWTNWNALEGPAFATSWADRHGGGEKLPHFAQWV
jgi:ATP-dependent DNA ligase